MKTVSLKLPEDLAAQLNAAVRGQRTSKSAIIRLALEDYLRRKGSEVRKGSVLDLAGDLVGCVDGPADLSFAKEHMESYGA